MKTHESLENTGARCRKTSVQVLTLTYSQEVFGWSKEPSRFLSEMGLLLEEQGLDDSDEEDFS